MPNDESHPKVAPEPASKTTSHTVQPAADIAARPALTSEVVARRRWAYRMVSRVPKPPPLYGSPEWLALPDGHYAKIASVVVAAECWARDGDELPEQLAREVEAARLAFKKSEDADYVARAEGWREEQRRQGRKTESFTVRRQRQLDASKPRPGDYQGRGKGA